MKISIITAVFNNKDFIGDSIRSVITQDYKDVEYILVDGASTDGTMDVVNKYKSDISKIISEKDAGIFDALNKGIKTATGDCIGFLHSDDVYADNGVISQVANVLSGSGVDSVYGDLVYVSRQNPLKVIRYWHSGDFKYNSLRWGWMPPHPALFIKKEIYDRFGYFDTSMKVSADYELILRFMLKHRISTAYLPRVLISMRLGGNSNKSITNIYRKISEDCMAAKRYGIPRIGILAKNMRKFPQFFIR